MTDFGGIVGNGVFARPATAVAALGCVSASTARQLVWALALAAASAAPTQAQPAAPSAAPAARKVTGDKPFVCTSRPQYEGLWGFEKDGLSEALGKGLAFAAITSACVMLVPGEVVMAEPGNPQSDFTQIRRQGSDKLWWIARQRLQ